MLTSHAKNLCAPQNGVPTELPIVAGGRLAFFPAVAAFGLSCRFCAVAVVFEIREM